MKDKDSEIRMDWLEDGPRLETSLRPQGEGTGMPLMQGMGPHPWVSASSTEPLFCFVTREGPTAQLQESLESHLSIQSF